MIDLTHSVSLALDRLVCCYCFLHDLYMGNLALDPPLLHSFIYGGRGHPMDTQVDLRDRSLAVCGAPLHHIPPRSYRRRV